jgi:hypothetical protein
MVGLTWDRFDCDDVRTIASCDNSQAELAAVGPDVDHEIGSSETNDPFRCRRRRYSEAQRAALVGATEDSRDESACLPRSGAQLRRNAAS